MDAIAEVQRATESRGERSDRDRSSRHSRSSRHDEDDSYSRRRRSRSRDRSDRYEDDRSSRRSRRDDDRDYRSSRRYEDDDRRYEDRRDRERSSRYDYDDRRSYSRRDYPSSSSRSDYRSDDRRGNRPADRDFRGRSAGGGGGGGSRSAAYESGPFGSGRRSPTPEDTMPISKRKRPRTGWDVKPPGMENVTALQAKMSGRFNLPGQNRPHLPPTVGGGGYGGLNAVPTFGSLEDNFPPGITYARQARRLYVGGITPAGNESNITDFFNQKMRETGHAKDDTNDVQSAHPVISVQVNHEKSYAFVEFRTADEASAGMSFDGVMFQGQSLKIRRPKDYLGNDLMGMSGPGGQIPDSPNKIFIGGLPSYLTEEQVRELLSSFGELKHFNLVKEYTGNSKGFAFAEYADPALTDIACEGLNGMELGDRYLVVQRASVGQGQKSNAGGGRGPSGDIASDVARLAPGIMAGSSEAEGNPTRVLQMLNMVTPEELVDDQDYEDIIEDTKEECGKYGEVIEIRIPRPARTDKGKMDLKASESVPNLGKVFVMFDSTDGAKKAMQAIAGRQFAGRVVVVAFADEATMIS